MAQQTQPRPNPPQAPATRKPRPSTVRFTDWASI